MTKRTGLKTFLIICAAAILQPALAQPSLWDYLPGEQAGVWVSAADGGWNSARTILLRGINSLHAGSTPLFIVDGVEVAPPINLDNPVSEDFLAFLPAGKPVRIEVLKNLSATALYGSRGANGVVVITTENPVDAESSVTGSSFAGASFPALTATGLTRGTLHHHKFTISGYSGHTLYQLGGNYRRYNAITGAGQQVGGGSFLLDSKPGSSLRFGMRLFGSVGEFENSPGNSYAGESSLMTILRTPYSFRGLDPVSWRNDHDDDSAFRRVLASTYLDLQLLPALEWHNTVSGDFLSNVRKIWYGLETPLGDEMNGYASHSGSRFFHAAARSQLHYSHYFNAHHLDFTAGAELLTDMRRINWMEGTDFFSHGLRADGLNLAKSSPVIHTDESNRSYFGLFAGLDYSWNGKAGFQTGIRHDRGQFYPWVSGFADIKQLIWTQQSPTLSSLRLEGGWGVAAIELVNSREMNISMLLGMFKDRLNLSATLYEKQTDDELSVIQNKGVEAHLEALVIRKGNFRWKVDLLGAFNQNRLLTVDSGDGYGAEIGHGLKPNVNKEGQSAFSFMGSFNSIPEWTAGLGSELSWNRWILEAHLDAAAGYYILDLNRLTGMQNLPWTVSEDYLDKGDYLRLKRLSLSYKCNEHFTFSVNAWNLFTLSYRDGWSPAADSFAGLVGAPGIDYGTCPRYCSLLAGVEYAF